MKKFYITFGQAHAHTIGEKTIDKDYVVVITAKNADDAHDRANELFNKKYAQIFDEKPDMSFFPKGIIEL